MKPAEKANAAQLEMGHLLEPIAAYWYAQKTGDTVTDDTNLYQHADHPYALADFDRRFTRSTDGEPGILECKSCSYHKAGDWLDGRYPLYYDFSFVIILRLRTSISALFLRFGGTIPTMTLRRRGSPDRCFSIFWR